ncbi:MAG: M3 family metallopeptidase [Acidobacteria bacterium]|jgi:peptidyl-dipeptidase Dcp|nr:M3 family metallopeptidase [Acidobacteriota bacterium]
MKKRPLAIIGILAVFALLAMEPAAAQAQQKDNPFFKAYTTPFQVPPFDRITKEHYLPAFKEGMKKHQAEIDAIAQSRKVPTFANTIAAMDHGGIFLSDVGAVFYALLGAETSPDLQAIARDVSPLLSAHQDNISLNEKLFARVKAVYDGRAKLALTPEESFLLENTYKGFIRSGALLDAAGKARLRQLNAELSLLGLKFGENLLAETNSSRIVIDSPEGLAGLPESVRAMGADAARQLKLDGKWVYTAQVPSLTPFLQYSARRDLREQLHRAYFMRGDRGNENDNKEIVKKIIALRAERAKLLGYPTYAHFVLEERMAKDPATVMTFLQKLWSPALQRASQEAAEMQAIIDREKGGFQLASWDWWHYAEKLRQEKYAFDDSALRPYFALENVMQGIFTLCEKLYGLQFAKLDKLPVYHPEVKVYEVKESDGRHVGLLYMDFHPRPGKRGGAWSGGLRREYYEKGKRVAPISTIVCNFTRPAAGAPSLLSIDEVSTFFHEFGHALSTLFADGVYRGRSVPRDAVELPSQIMENWALEPELLTLYARHHQTGEVIPPALVEKLKASSLFNQGFETVEYLAASLLDMAWHTVRGGEIVDVRSFEAGALNALGLIPAIEPRYRTPYFNHMISGYAAGYYSYIWSGVLDKDAYEAFKEKGIFDRSTATSFRENILAKLGTEDAPTLYKRFRGAEPKIEPLLRSRGLLSEEK